MSDQYSISKYGSIPQNVNFGVKSVYINSLLKDPISKQSVADSLDDAINATVRIEPINKKNARSNGASKNIKLTINYTSYWDVFYHQLTSFQLVLTDIDTGQNVAKISGGGEHASGMKGVVNMAVDELQYKVAR